MDHIQVQNRLLDAVTEISAKIGLQLETVQKYEYYTYYRHNARLLQILELIDYLGIHHDYVIVAIMTDGTGDKLRAVMQAPVKGYFSNGREKDKLKHYAAAELAKVTELQRRSKEVTKMIPKLAKLATEHTVTKGTFAAIYGPIPCQYHTISGPTFNYKFVTL